MRRRHISEYRQDPANARKHNPRNIGMIVDSLHVVGAARSLVANEEDQILVGNGTWEAAGEAGIEDVLEVTTTGREIVIVKRPGLSEEQQVKLAIADNRAAELASWDPEVLATIDPEILNSVFFPDELKEILADIEVEGEDGKIDPDEQDTTPPAEPVTKPGDLWILGKHRLLCGDATNVTDVERVMTGEIAALIATDPPYGVAYGIETGQDNKFGAITNDDKDGQQLQAFLEATFRTALPHLRANAAWYLWHAQLTQGFFAAAAAAAQILFHRQIIWVKPSLVLGHGDYHWRHELCFYGWREGNRAPWYGDRKQTTVWEIGRENDHIHPTQKPVEIFRRPMEFNTRPGELCYEPFAGSGSQFMAAEVTGRRCYGLEIEPRFCDVIVRRFEELTGAKAELEKTN